MCSNWKMVIGGAGLCFVLGCGSNSTEPAAKDIQPLKAEHSLGNLLTKPRSELAEQAAETRGKIDMQIRALREGRLSFSLAPDLGVAFVVPIFHEAQYSTPAGLSLPPYVKEKGVDPELARHLARFGDREAAQQFADPKDEDTAKALAASTLTKNYPLEWSRLVALLLYDAEFRMAGGDPQGAHDFMSYQRQLSKLLDDRTKSSPLGIALLSIGRNALGQAVKSWTANNKPELAAEGSAILAEKIVVSACPGLGHPAKELDRTFPVTKGSLAIAAPSPLRALDLLEIPFPPEGAEAVVGFVDASGKLTRVLVTYKAGLSQNFKSVDYLAGIMHDRNVPSQSGPDSIGVSARTFELNEMRIEAGLLARGRTLGGYACLAVPSEEKSSYQLERSFGIAGLDRSFETMRLRLAPDQRKEMIESTQAGALAQVGEPLPVASLQQLSFNRQQGFDTPQKLVFQFVPLESKPAPFHEVVMPLWRKQGFVPFKGVADESGGHLQMVWRDSHTTEELGVPFESSHSIRLTVADNGDPTSLGQRAKAVWIQENADRKDRIAKHKPLQVLPRKLENLSLGATEEQVLSSLPTGQAALKRNLPNGGLMVTFPLDGSAGDAQALRQAFLRYGPDGGLVEMRLRYDDASTQAQKNWASNMLKDLEKRYGAAETIPSPWTNLWSDLGTSRVRPVARQWQDDITRLTYLRDSGGVELTLLDCPADHPTGMPLSPLEALSRGPDRCQLGDTRESIVRNWKVSSSTPLFQGGIVLRPAPATGLDALIVWFENNRVVRVLGRHAAPSGKDPATMGQTVRTAWGRGMQILGWPRRQEVGSDRVLQGLSWHDDVTRIRIFWVEPDNGPARVFTEWMTPAGPKTIASK